MKSCLSPNPKAKGTRFFQALCNCSQTHSSDLGKRKVLLWEMLWECDCLLGGSTGVVAVVLGMLAELWTPWGESRGAALELGASCGSGFGARLLSLPAGTVPRARWGGCPLCQPPPAARPPARPRHQRGC